VTKILIAGDSFACDWGNDTEWWKLLDYSITNVAQAGASEYKIIKSLINIDNYDLAIVFHTSPSRIYTTNNIKHTLNKLHRDSCYVIGDILADNSRLADAMRLYVKYFYDEEYINYTHRLMLADVIRLTSTIPTIHASGFDYTNIYTFDCFIPANDLFTHHGGNSCHLNNQGNVLLADRINKQIMDIIR
jgi:hypothetical protein